MKIIAVTGSTGMIGKKVVEILKKRGYKVKEFIVEGRRGNVEEISEVKEFLKDVDGVIHLAVRQNGKKYDEFYKTNVIGSENIAKVCRTYDIKNVYVSTIMVFRDSNKSINENCQLESPSSNYYVKSKVEGLKKALKFNPKSVIVYPTIVIGNNKKPKGFFKYLIWKFVGGGVPGGVMSMVGNKNRMMNIVNIDDVALGIILSLERGKEGQGYILGGLNIKAIDYVRKMRPSGFGIFNNFRFPEFVAKAIFGTVPKNMMVNINKAKVDLGYRPKWNLR